MQTLHTSKLLRWKLSMRLLLWGWPIALGWLCSFGTSKRAPRGMSVVCYGSVKGEHGREKMKGAIGRKRRCYISSSEMEASMFSGEEKARLDLGDPHNTYAG